MIYLPKNACANSLQMCKMYMRVEIGMAIKYTSCTRLRLTSACLSFFRWSSRDVLHLHERGLYQDIFPANSTNEVSDLLKNPQCVYAGFDPTADSLHVGNLLVLIGLLQWQRAGHHIIALVGSATACIGDPSGHTRSRPEMGKGVVDQNSVGLHKNIHQIFTNHQELFWDDKRPLGNFMLEDNGRWYKGVSAGDFVSGVCRHLRLGTILSRQSVRTRLASDSGMSLAELCYQAFQAYDWLHLYRSFGCRFQLGGADQMGNIVSGHDLVSRVANKSVYGFTMPLVTSETGDKLGKSAGNAVWLQAHRTSPFELYQFFLRTSDADVGRLLQLFTFDSLPSIQELLRVHKPRPEERRAQRRLAETVTRLVHGEAGLAEACRVSEALYAGSTKALAELQPSEVASALQGAPLVHLPADSSITMLQLALRAGCFRTEDDALRVLAAGGFSVNHERVRNPLEVVARPTHVLPNNLTLLRVGKKNYYVVQWLD